MPQHTSASKELSKLAPPDIRARCRELSRLENEHPKIKWAVFQEQHRTEERAALRFERMVGKEGEFKRGTLSGVVDKIIKKIARAVDKQMKEKGGTAFSIIRSTFLNWDADASGEMSKAEVVGALRMLKCSVKDSECDALVKYYDLEGDGEMKYQPLVEDITRASPHFLNHPNTERLNREVQDSARAAVELDNKVVKVMPRVCELFLKKLQRNLLTIMREKGGTEHSLLRANFLNWDADKSGEIGVKEFMGAVNQFGLKLSTSEASAIVDYYDLEGDGEMKYEPLVKDVVSGTSHFMVHPSTARTKTPATPTQDLALIQKAQDEEALFSARPRKRPPNAVVEAFKAKLRNKLEMQMRMSGGTIFSICRESFLMWDGDCSGKLDVREFMGALSKMGLSVSESDARQIVKVYDLEDEGEMSYHELVKDVVEGVPDMLSWSLTGRGEGDERVEPASAGGKPAPSAVKRIEAKIKESADLAATKSVTKISGQDLFYGTCIRFDTDNTGRLSKGDLERVFKEIRCKLGVVEVKHLVGWYDMDATDSIEYKKIVRSAWRPLDLGRLGGGGGGGVVRGSARDRKMNFKSDALTARANRAGVLAEKARIERKIKDIALKERMIRSKIDTIRGTAR